MSQLIKDTGDVLTNTGIKVMQTSKNCYFFFGTYEQTSIASKEFQETEKVDWTYYLSEKLITDSVKTVEQLQMAILEYATDPKNNFLMHSKLKIQIINAMGIVVEEPILV
jgi:hypothetical protein